jgi:hypothetical protein
MAYERGLSEDQAANQLRNLFDSLQKSLKEAEGKKAPEEKRAAINANIMSLNLGISSVINRIKRWTPELIQQLNSGLTQFWEMVSKLLNQIGSATIKDWKVGVQIEVGVPPRARFSLDITYQP